MLKSELAKKPNSCKELLESLIEQRDVDGVLYDLRQIAVDKRAAADAENANPAEVKYWQGVVELLCDMEEKLMAL